MNATTLLDLQLIGSGASIDSRTVQRGQIFFGLSGEHTDGSRFAQDALQAGAMIAVIQRDKCADVEDDRYWLVDDVLETMQNLALEYRRHMAIKVMAITGSNGKTTNKNLLHMALSVRFRIHSTAGNFNNHIGLPLTILNAPMETEFLLLEMGTNHFGEIRDLCRIAEPDFGSIINVGKSHLEFLGSVQGVLRAKSELADDLYSRRGLLFLNEEESSLQPLVDHPVEKIFLNRRSLPGNDFEVEVQKSSPEIVLLVSAKSVNERYKLQSSLWGEHNVRNLIHALAVGSYFEAPMAEMIDALSEYTPLDNRSQIVTWRGHRVFLDAYNANPTSMAQAIRSFREANPSEGILVLGEMGELGADAAGEHEMILELVKELGFAHVNLVGSEFRKAGSERFSTFHFVDDVMELKDKDWSGEAPLLIKGSRFMALERLVQDSENG